MTVSEELLNVVEICGNSLQLNEGNLSSVLSQVGDDLIATVCVCGLPRQGKKLLLDYFAKYLKDLEGDRDNRFDGPFPDFGVNLKPGIWVWNKVFKIKHKQGQGVKSVILLYLNGAFDDVVKPKSNSLVQLAFQLSTHIVINSPEDVEESFLSTLNNYLRNDEGQKGIVSLLIRDWSRPFKFPYGLKGGKELIKQMLQARESQSYETIKVREKLLEKVECFLLPFPGEVVLNDSKRSAEEPNVIFTQRLEDLTRNVLNTETLTQGSGNKADTFKQRLIDAAGKTTFGERASVPEPLRLSSTNQGNSAVRKYPRVPPKPVNPPASNTATLATEIGNSLITRTGKVASVRKMFEAKSNK